MYNDNLSMLPVPEGSPNRIFIPDERLSWEHASQFDIPNYTKKSVLEADALERWSDPMDSNVIKELGGLPNRSMVFNNLTKDDEGFYLNPFGNTGIDGKLENGKWGANPCVDIAVVRKNKEDKFEIVVIKKEVDGPYMLPGGHLDIFPMESLEDHLKRESIIESGARELKEETTLLMGENALTLIEGLFLHDPNTSNRSWRETSLVFEHLEGDLAQQCPVGCDDAKAGAFWVPVDNLHNEISSTHKILLEFVRNHVR